MLNDNTLLILGAGASIPFGFPSGPELVRIIYESLDNRRWEKEFNDLGFRPIMPEFKKELYRSNISSIDAFLERRQEFLWIGKASIARALIPYEEEGKLFNVATRGSNWYWYLFNRLLPSLPEIPEHRFTIVTFNYDRSIDYFLFSSIKSSFGFNDERCATVMKRIPIIHVHGQLGCLPWQGENSRLYQSNATEEEFSLASQSIKIISDEVDNTEESKRAKHYIQNAGKIYILGFGYNDRNIERLDTNILKTRRIIGTSYCLGDSEQREIIEKWPFIKLAKPEYDALGFLRNVAEFR